MTGDQNENLAHPSTDAVDFKRDRPAILMVLLIVIVGVALVVSFKTKFDGLGSTQDDWGQFGDFIGGLLNPFISFFTLIVATEVWRLQREELQQTRVELTKQAKTAEQQRQEQRFFDLLNLYHRTVDTVTLAKRSDSPSGITIKGKEVFALILALRSNPPILKTINQFVHNGFKFREQHSYASLTAIANAPSPRTITLTQSDLESAWLSESGVLDHYFRAVFRILAEADRLLGNQQDTYIKLLRAQFSKDEIQLLALFMWLDDEGAKMIPLAEKYGILKHLPSGQLRSHLENVFPPNVFGRKFAESRRTTAKTA